MNEPDPALISTPKELAQQLIQLYTSADKPSLREVERRSSKAAGTPLPGTNFKRVVLGRTYLNDVLNGNRFPRKAFLLTFVEICGVDLGADRGWESAWNKAATHDKVSNVGKARNSSGPSVSAYPEEVQCYTDRGQVNRRQWNNIIDKCSQTIWIYGMAELNYASDDQVPGILTHATSEGCSVRILLLNPDCPIPAMIDADEGTPAGTLAARIRAALSRFQRMRQQGNGLIQIRTFDAHPTVSIARGDGNMLVTPYLRFFIGSNSPTLELSRETAPIIFGRYERHFEQSWELAEEWT
jgi:hypothetical protein